MSRPPRGLATRRKLTSGLGVRLAADSATVGWRPTTAATPLRTVEVPGALDVIGLDEQASRGGGGGHGTITIEGLTKRFGEVVAVDDLSFEVDQGTVVGFLGPTGPARPPPYAPCSAWSPRPPAPPGSTASRIGSWPIPSATSARCWRPPASIPAAAPATTSGSSPPPPACPSRADEVLAQVGLAQAARRRVGGFSLGMRQRLGLATALLGDPQVLILDEPANGLDPEGVHWLRGLLRQLADQGRTVLVSSHVLAEVAQTVDQVVIIAAGRLVTQSTLAALTARTDQLVRVRTPKPRPCGRCWPPRASRPTRTGPTSCSRSAPPPRRSARRRRRPGSSSTRWAPSAPTSRTSSSSSPARKEPDHDPSCPRRVHQAATTRLIYGVAAAMAAFAVLTVVANILDRQGAPPLSADSLPCSSPPR